MAKEIKYEVKEIIGRLDSDSTMPKELRLISWNNSTDKYDLRGWSKDENGNERMSKGVTMDREELESLYYILKDIFEKE